MHSQDVKDNDEDVKDNDNIAAYHLHLRSLYRKLRLALQGLQIRSPSQHDTNHLAGLPTA